MSDERFSEMVERARLVCDPWETFTADDGELALRTRPAEELATAALEAAGIEELLAVRRKAENAWSILREEHIEEEGACFACEVEWPCAYGELGEALHDPA